MEMKNNIFILLIKPMSFTVAYVFGNVKLPLMHSNTVGSHPPIRWYQWAAAFYSAGTRFYSKAHVVKNIQEHMLSVDKMVPRIKRNERCWILQIPSFSFHIIRCKWEGGLSEGYSRSNLPSLSKKSSSPTKFSDNCQIYLFIFLLHS